MSSEQATGGKSRTQKETLRLTEDKEEPVEGRQHVQIQVDIIRIQKTLENASCLSPRDAAKASKIPAGRAITVL